MAHTSAEPPREVRTSLQLDQFADDVEVVRAFQAYGTQGDVYGRVNANVVLPFIGKRLDTQVPLDPVPDPAKVFVDLLSGFRDRGRPSWESRLYCTRISIIPKDKDPTIHDVVATFTTRGRHDPRAPEIDIREGVEPFTLRWDWNGNPIVPGVNGGGIPSDNPIVFLSYSVPIPLFDEIFKLVAQRIGQTNSEPWKVWGGRDNKPGDKFQWVFTGANASKRGELNWKPTFSFTWLPPIAIQHFKIGEDEDGPVTEAVIAEQRGKFFYWFVEKADGSINQRVTGPSTVQGSSLRGLQHAQRRDTFDFNEFFTDEGIDVEEGA